MKTEWTLRAFGVGVITFLVVEWVLLAASVPIAIAFKPLNILNLFLVTAASMSRYCRCACLSLTMTLM